MPRQDYSTFESGLDSPARVHEALAATTLRTFSEDEMPRAIRADADGIIVIKDQSNPAVEVTYNVLQGEILPVMASEITASTTIAVQILW